VEGVSVKTETGVWNCLFRRYRPVVAFEAIQSSNVGLRINLREICRLCVERSEVCVGNIEIIIVSKIYKVRVTVFFCILVPDL
jgi:hypothetical protein